MRFRAKTILDNIRKADQTARDVTGKGISDHAKDMYERLEQSVGDEEEDTVDHQDLADCKMLGLEPGCSEQAFRAAIKDILKKTHPDRFQNDDDKKMAEHWFKQTPEIWNRICDRRGWNPKL